MKNLYLFIFSISLLTLACSPYRSNTVYYERPQRVEPANEVGYDEFYNDLSPYGRWIDYPEYGYVWVPNAGPDFRPYASNGHWVYTDYGWTWVSGYQWGWATFHYGRWIYEDNYGWAWVPGREWAPAWVTWGHSGDYYGWAPLAPRVNINVSMGNEWNPPQHYWNFVPAQHITQMNVNNYVVNTTNNITVVNNITKNVTIINNTTNNNVTNNNVTNNNVTNNNINIHNTTNNNVVYNAGPHVNEIERITNQRIQPMHVTTLNKPSQPSVNGNQIQMFRPVIRTTNTNQMKPVPQTIETYKPSQINTNNNNSNNEPNKALNPSVSNQPQNQTLPEKRLIDQRPPQQQPVNIQPQRNQPQNNIVPVPVNPNKNNQSYQSNNRQNQQRPFQPGINQNPRQHYNPDINNNNLKPQNGNNNGNGNKRYQQPNNNQQPVVPQVRNNQNENNSNPVIKRGNLRFQTERQPIPKTDKNTNSNNNNKDKNNN